MVYYGIKGTGIKDVYLPSLVLSALIAFPQISVEQAWFDSTTLSLEQAD